MLNNTSIQEIPSIEEVSPTKPRHPMKHHLEIDSKILSRLSVDSGRDSPELKRCSILCPKDQPNAFTLESRIDKILKKTNRTINEAVLLYKNIKNFDFFRKFKAEHNKELCTTEALLHLCKSMKSETFFPGTIIYRKDEDSNQKIYLVFSGRVATATEAQEYATKESQQNKYKSVNNLGEEDDELNPAFKKDSRVTKTYKKLIPQKTTSKGSDGSPKHSPGMKRTESKKDSTGMQKSKAKNGTRMSAGEMSDKELAEWRAKCSLETLVERKITKQSSTISPREPNSNGLNRESSVPSKVMETLATTETSIKKATRSNTIAFFGTRRSASSRNMTDKMLHSPFNGERGIPPDFQAVLKLVPQITHLGSIGEGRFVGDAEPQEYPGYSQVMDNVAGTLETSLYKEDNKNLFTSNPSKEKITEDPEDLLGKEDLSESMDSIESDSIQEVQEGRDEPGTTKKKFGIRKGGTFGDEVLKSHGERKETMVATVFTQVLTFTVHDYDYITTRFEKTNTKRLNFLLDHVPGLEKAIKYDKIKNVEVHFQELDFSLHNHIVREGEKGKNIYIIVEGMCKVFKEPVDPLNQSQNLDSRPSMSNLDTPRKKMEGAADKILMCLIQPGAFIGEEILFQDSKLYQYTVKAASANVKVMAIKKSTFMRIMPQDVINSLKDLHMTRYEHKKIIFANKLKMSTTLAVPQRNSLLKRFSSISISKDIASSFSKSKLGQREQDSSIYDSWTAQETPRNMTLSAEPNKAPSIVTSKTLTLNIPRSQRTLSYVSQDEVSTQDKELSRTPRKYLTNSYPAAVAGKTWDIYTKLQPLEFNRGNSKDSGSPERAMAGSMQKLKTTFTKFGHLSTLEVPSLVDVSMKVPNEVLPKPSPKARQNLRATAMSFNTSISQLPKIDPTDIEGLRFDFGEKQKEKEVKKNVEFSKKTGKCISLQNSREASPRNVVPLICMVSPKNANYLFKHTRAKSGAGVITPKALLESCKELKEEMQAKSIKKKKAQAFVFPAVMNPSPIPMKTPKSEQNSFLDKTEIKNSSPIKNMSPVSNDPLRSAIKNRANRLILKAGVLGRGCGGIRNTSEGKQSVEP